MPKIGRMSNTPWVMYYHHKRHNFSKNGVFVKVTPVQRQIFEQLSFSAGGGCDSSLTQNATCFSVIDRKMHKLQFERIHILVLICVYFQRIRYFATFATKIHRVRGRFKRSSGILPLKIHSAYIK
ncbi:hypothetical protein AALO_G00089280, partial [Alosa alosa]